MIKSHYLNFNEYAQFDHDYLMRVIKNQLYEPQIKLEFRDGTTYQVSNYGNRYWEKNNRLHREDGAAADYGNMTFYSLFGTVFVEAEYRQAVDRLNFLRLATDNQLETLVEEISRNMSYEQRQCLWKCLLQGSEDYTAMIASLKTLSKQYNKLVKMYDKFIQDFAQR